MFTCAIRLIRSALISRLKMVNNHSSARYNQIKFLMHPVINQTTATDDILFDFRKEIKKK